MDGAVFTEDLTWVYIPIDRKLPSSHSFAILPPSSIELFLHQRHHQYPIPPKKYQLHDYNRLPSITLSVPSTPTSTSNHGLRLLQARVRHRQLPARKPQAPCWRE